MEGNVQDQKSVVNRLAALLVHIDYTPSSGLKRVWDTMKDETEELLKGRVAFFNVWKPFLKKWKSYLWPWVIPELQQMKTSLRWSWNIMNGQERFLYYDIRQNTSGNIFLGWNRSMWFIWRPMTFRLMDVYDLLDMRLQRSKFSSQQSATLKYRNTHNCFF